jgi:hypothetical protein
LMGEAFAARAPTFRCCRLQENFIVSPALVAVLASDEIHTSLSNASDDRSLHVFVGVTAQHRAYRT